MAELRTSWSLASNVHPMKIGVLLDVLTDLGLSVRGLFEKEPLYGSDGGWRVLQAIVRQISVPLRKLCLDNEGELLKTTIASPTFCPLGGPKGQYRRATITFYSERQEWNLGYADGKAEAVVVPKAEHKIEVGRLYGVEFLEDGVCKMSTPFDHSAMPMPMEDWLDAKVLQINSVSYTIRDALALVANFEGAHTNDLTPWLAVGVNPDDIDKKGRKKARLMHSVYFGCLSYAHIVVLFTGLYITERMWRLLAERDGIPADLNAAAVVERLIRNVPADLVLNGKIVNGTHQMIVVGKSNAPGARRREPVYRIWSGSQDWDEPPSE